MKKQIQLAVIFSVIFSFTSLLASEGREPAILKIMTYNVWVGGGGERLPKTIEVMKVSGANIIGTQESNGNLEAFANALGFASYVPAQILSRYPIREIIEPIGVVVEIAPDKKVAIFNCHLQPFPYGPYDLRDGVSLEKVLENERTIHVRQVAPYLEAMKKLKERGIPIFFTGDMNVPSHLDWIQENAVRHFGLAVQWPLSKLLEESGLSDSYRTFHPDVLAYPGITWTPLEAPNEVYDRIDFVYFHGNNVYLLDSKVMGEEGPYSDISLKNWPSDHRVVVSTFRIERK